MKTPESRSGLRRARFWNTKASISIPAPATAQPISDPRMPVATPNRAGSENTPAPTMPPTTIPVRVGRLIFPGAVATEVSAAGPATRGGGIVSTIVSSLRQDVEDQPGDPADQDGDRDGGEQDPGETVQERRRRRPGAALHVRGGVQGHGRDRG